jgi:hypothetical protein
MSKEASNPEGPQAAEPIPYKLTYKLTESGGHVFVIADLVAPDPQALEWAIESYFRSYPREGYATEITMEDPENGRATIRRYATCD